MANTLNNPLEELAAADIPNTGIPAAPEGDTAGTNPFAGKILQENLLPQDSGPGTPTPPPPAPPAAPVDSNPFAGHKFVETPDSAQGTAAGSVGGVSGVGAPAAASSVPPVKADTSNPFAGHQLDTPAPGTSPHVEAQVMGEGNLSQNPDDWSDLQRQVVGLPPKGSIEDYKQKAVRGFSVARDMLVSTVQDMANAIEVGAAQDANNAANSSVIAPDSVLDVSKQYAPEKLQSAARGQAMITTQFVPGFELAPESFFARNLVGKVLAMSANGAVIGAGYGALAPKEEGQSTFDSITRNAVDFAWQTPIFHGVFLTLGWPVKKALGLTGIPQKIARAWETPGLTPDHLVKAAQDVHDILQKVQDEGANPKDIPQEHKEALIALSIQNAVDQPDFASLDDKTIAFNMQANKLHAMQGPRDVSLPEPGPSEGQVRIAQGVYKNLDGSVEAYGYRGVTKKYIRPDHPEGEGTLIDRSAIDPGQMDVAFSSPNPEFSGAFGDLHYVGARFKNPLIIDNWHDSLDPVVEAAANAENKAIHQNSNIPWEPGTESFGGAQLYHPKYGEVGYLGHRQPGVIEAARMLGHDGIIVRHGNEAVEIVALNPGKSMFSAGAADGGAAESIKGDAWQENPPLSAAPKGWDAVGPGRGSFTAPVTAEQKLVATRARRLQNGAIDLGTSNKAHVISQSPTLRAGKVLDQGNYQNGVRGQADVSAFHAIMDIIEKHNNVSEGHLDESSGTMWENRNDGVYKIDGRVYNIKRNFDAGYTIQDITGQLPALNSPGVSPVDTPDPFENYTKLLSSTTLSRGDPLTFDSNSRYDKHVYSDLSDMFEYMPAGVYKIGGMDVKYTPGEGVDGHPSGHPTFQDNSAFTPKADPTVHPDIIHAALLHDGISKGNSQIDYISQLGPTNQAAAKVLVGYEPNPVGFSSQSLNEKLHIQGERALDKAAAGHIDEALLNLTSPRELDLERPELSNPKGERTKLGGTMLREKSRLDQGLGPPGKKLTLEQIYSSGPKGDVAMDGRIYKETVDEHIRNAVQMLQFGETHEAAKRLRWAQEKNPVEAATAIDKDSRLVKLNNSPEMVEQRQLAKVKLLPWEQDVLSKYQQMMNTVRLGAPDQIERVQGYITETLENARARAAGAPTIGEDQVGMLHIAPATQERAPWSPVPPGTVVPQVPSDWAMLARMEESLRNGVIEKVELPGVTKATKVVTRSSLTGKTITTNKVGSANMQLIFRIVSGGSSGLLNIAAANTDDPEIRKWLFMAGGVTAALTIMPRKGGWFEGTTLGKAFMRAMDLPALMRSEVGIPAADKLRDATDIANYFIGTAKMRGDAHAKMFPTPDERKLAAYALDDPKHPAWGKLSPDQQQAVGREGIINHQMGQMLKARGIINQFRDNYIRHIFPDETYNAWRSAKGSLNGGGFTKPRAFNTFADAENWAKANNLPGPLIDIVQLQSKHFLEVGRAIMGDQIQKDMRGLGLLIDRTGGVPVGWVAPRVAGMHDLVAPQSVATALERLSNYRPGIIDSQTLRALDTVKGWQMRMVMAFPWIHGMNVARGALALDGTGLAYNRAMEALSAADPSVARALKHGTLLFDRPDYAPQHAEGFQKLLEKAGSGLPDFLNNKTFQGASNFLKSGETALWDKWVPALGLASFNLEMHKWTENTGGKFAEGTPEFKAAGRRAADNANIQMGKSLQMLRDPGLALLLRNIFFAPQWMESRIRLSMASLGEFRDVATGEIPLQEVKLLPSKVRGIMIGAAFTWIASKLWSGQAPQFNPNNSKFYIRTGIFDSNKREVGVDLAGWYADDIKMYSDPAKFFMNRLSPTFQVVHTAISGRDAFGRAIGGLELVDQTANELGPPGSMVDAAARTYLQGGITGADAIKGALSTSDFGSSSSLPRPDDLKLQGAAYRALQKYNLPTDEDAVYQLQQLIGSNARRGLPAMDGAVTAWLAFRRREYERQYPKSAATRYLFQQAADALRVVAKP